MHVAVTTTAYRAALLAVKATRRNIFKALAVFLASKDKPGIFETTRIFLLLRGTSYVLGTYISVDRNTIVIMLNLIPSVII